MGLPVVVVQCGHPEHLWDRLGPVLRKPTQGPEYDLVSSYVESRLPVPPRGQALTVFIEPRIASGFPDIVAVYWHVATTRDWTSQREQLSKVDIRVLHYLALSGATEKEQLTSFFTPAVEKSLRRLQDVGLLKETRKQWQTRSLEKIFAVRRLIAIEAKINEWQEGLHQAFHNTWFASESFLLLPALPRYARVVGEAARHGVGVVTCQQSLDCAEAAAREERIPKSYASWLFNEWAWKATRSPSEELSVCKP